MDYQQLTQMGSGLQDWKSFAVSKKEDALRAVEDNFQTIEQKSKNEEETAAELGMAHIGTKGMIKGGKEAILKMKKGYNLATQNLTPNDGPKTLQGDQIADERFTSEDVIEEQQQILGRGDIELTDMNNNVTTSTTTTTDNVEETTSSIGEQLSNLTDTVTNTTGDVINDTVNGLKNAVSTGLDTAVDTVTDSAVETGLGVADAVESALGPIGWVAELFTVGAGIATAVAGVVKGAKGDAIKQVSDKAINMTPLSNYTSSIGSHMALATSDSAQNMVSHFSTF